MHALSLIQRVAVWVLPVLFAITVHEVSHGWVARRLGDPTAHRLGRLTLNPIRHVDPMGTLVVPGLLLLFSPFVLGWAKPVPITWENLRQPKRDMALVALAGPAANLLMALLWAGVLKLGLGLSATNAAIGLPLLYMGSAGVVINTVLMIFNLLPLPPLDGSRVVSALLPGPMAWQYNRLEPYGLFIVLGLLVTGLLGRVLWPPMHGFLTQLADAYALPLRILFAAAA